MHIFIMFLIYKIVNLIQFVYLLLGESIIIDFSESLFSEYLLNL